MSVIRVKKSKNYTVMSNNHLRDNNISLKARGLLSTILSLPDDWNYSINGLVSICKENESSIKSGLNELKEAGYVVIEKLYSNESGTGKFKYVYNIFESPKDSEKLREQIKKKKEERASRGENPPVENPPVEVPSVENAPLNKYTEILNTDKLNTDLKNTDSNKDFPKGKTIDNKVFSGKKTGHSPSPDISYDYSLEEFKHFITQKVSYILDDLEPSEKPTALEPIVAIITDFYKKYYDEYGERHPILTDAVYTKIILKLLEPVEPVCKKDCYLDVDAYDRMINKFFETTYGKYSGHTTDHRMPYFMQDTVQENLLYQAGRHFDYN